MKSALLIFAASGFLATAGGQAVFAQSTPAAAPTTQSGSGASCPSLLNHTFKRLQDESDQSLCQYAGKVVLVVNTASYCGFTPQYQALEDLYAKYRDRGLVVVGFPSNDFSQEPNSDKEIADFCYNTYGVKFPMMSKTSVVGKDANEFYVALASGTGKKPGWNFFKYFIDRNGAVVASFPSSVTPTDRKFVAELERLLGPG